MRQLGGVIGTAIAVVLIGQWNAPLEHFRQAFYSLAFLCLVTACIALCLPASMGSARPIASQ